jgi:hypothetical protein
VVKPGLEGCQLQQMHVNTCDNSNLNANNNSPTGALGHRMHLTI